MSILSGMLAYADASVLQHGDALIKLIKFANEKALNERSWSITSRLITRLFIRLTTHWTEDARFVNKDEWNSEHFKQNSHLYWGKVYKRADCNIDWHIPGPEELNFVSRLLKVLVEPTLVALETGIPASGAPTKAWTNSFCRQLSFLRHCLDGLYAYYLEDPATKLGGEGKVASDKGFVTSPLSLALSIWTDLPFCLFRAETALPSSKFLFPASRPHSSLPTRAARSTRSSRLSERGSGSFFIERRST